MRDSVTGRRECLASFICHLDCVRLLLSQAFPRYSNLRETISHIHLLLYMKSMTTNRTCQMRQYISARAHDSSPQCLACSVGCWRAFCKTEGLGCGVGREPAILMIFSGCITISLEVPSVHQGHAIHCRKCVIGARHLPSLPGISESLKQR